MKAFILSLFFVAIAIIGLKAQEPKKFIIDTTEYTCMVRLDIPKPELFTDMYYGDTKQIQKQFHEALRKLPQSVKDKISGKRIMATFYFNTRGEVYYIFFIADKSMYNDLFDIDWVTIYNAIKHLKIDDMTTLDFSPGFRGSKCVHLFKIPD